MACTLVAVAGGWLAFLNARVVVGAGSASVAVEAAAFGVAGVVIALTASRAAWRRRGRLRAPEPALGPSAEPRSSGATDTVGAPGEDPLATYRRWKLR